MLDQQRTSGVSSLYVEDNVQRQLEKSSRRMSAQLNENWTDDDRKS